MNRGDILNLGDLGKMGAKAVEEGDMDKLLQLLDKADKLLSNPLVQGLLGPKKPVYNDAIPAVQIVEKVPDGAVIPKSAIHGKLFSMMNKMEPEQLMALLSTYGGEENAQKVLQPEVSEGQS